MTIETFAVGRLACNCTIIGDDAGKTAIVVDGGDGVDEVMERLDARGLRATLLIHTHAHFDHIGDVGRLRDRTDAKALLHPGDLPLYRALPLQAKWAGMDRAPRVVDLDGDLLDGDRIQLGAARIDVHHTPGHTPGSLCFAVRDAEGAAVLLTGDTLFAGSIGRWDLGGTSMEDIVASIHAKLMDYPDATAVIPGHGNFTTIGTERNSNPYLK